MGDFSKIGLRVALSNEKMAAWLDRMSPAGMEREPLRAGDVADLWSAGAEEWQVGMSFLSGTSPSAALGGLFFDEGRVDEEEAFLRSALESRLRAMEGGMAMLRATMRSIERAATGDLQEKLGEITELMDKSLPDGLREAVVSASEAAMAQVQTPAGKPGKPRSGL